MDRNFAQSSQEVRVAMSDWHPPTDQIMLTGMLERLCRKPQAQSIPSLREFAADIPGITVKAEALITSAKLGDTACFDACLKKSPEELKALNDPLMKLVIELYPAWAELRSLDKTRDGRLNQLYG